MARISARSSSAAVGAVATTSACRFRNVLIALAAAALIVGVHLSTLYSTESISNFLALADVYASNERLLKDGSSLTPSSSCPMGAATKKILPRETVLSIVQNLFHSKCGKEIDASGLLPREKGCRFADFGQTLFEQARKEGQHLLTVQLGGMDGKSNDPMYAMFSPQKDLSPWLPAVFEPVKYNFQNLQKTYQELAKEKSLSCSLLAQQAISDDPTTSTCTFCYFDNSPESPEACKKKPDWMRLQLGSLQCDESMKYFARDQQCLIHEDVPCRSIDQSVQQWGLALSDVAILQVDVEGFELAIFQGMLNSAEPDSFPPVLHFETKVLQHRDRKDKTKTYVELVELLRKAGYLLLNDGEDALALLAQTTLYSSSKQ